MWDKGFLIVEFIVIYVSAYASGTLPPSAYSECFARGAQCLMTSDYGKCQIAAPYACDDESLFCCAQRKAYQPNYPTDQCTSNGGSCQVFTGYGSKCDIMELPYRCSNPASMCCLQPTSNPYPSPYPKPYQPTPYPYPFYPNPYPQVDPLYPPVGSVGSGKPRT